MDIMLQEAVDRFRAVAKRLGHDVLRPIESGRVPLAALESLGSELSPLALPDDLVSWWTSWDPSSLGFLEESAFSFYGPAKALEEWRFLQDLEMPKALLPICKEEKRLLSIELPTMSHPGCRLFEIGFHGENLSLLGVGVADLLNLVAESLEGTEVDQSPEEYRGPVDWEVYERVTADAGEAFGSIRIDEHDKASWPSHWLEVEGFDEEWLRPRGRTHTISDFDAAREKAWPLTGVLQGVWAGQYSGGNLNGSVDRLEDESGWVQVFVPFGIPHAGIGPGGQCEMEVVAVPASGIGVGSLPGGCEALDAVMGGTDAVGDWILRLAAAASELDLSIVVTAVRPLR